MVHAAQTAVAFRSLLARNICVSSFCPIFVNVSGDVAVQWRTELVTWVLGAVAKPIETRVPKLLEKEQCDRPSSVQGTLTCPTPPHPLPHILQAAEHQQRVQRTRNVNMPHPTPPTDPRGRSINLVPKPWKWLTNGERHTAVYAACANYIYIYTLHIYIYNYIYIYIHTTYIYI